MKHYLLFLGLFASMFLHAQTVIEKLGTISADETWSEDTVKVTADVLVNNGITLTIEPGVYVEFQGHYQLNIQGRILAQGSPNDRIVFTAKDTNLTTTSGGWNAIRFNYTSSSNDSSLIEYCSMMYGNDFKESLVNNSGGAILFNGFSKALVSNNIITKCYGKAAVFCYNSKAVFTGNLIADNNATGMYLWNSYNIFVNNTIVNNTNYGLNASSCNAVFANGIIANNGSGNFSSSLENVAVYNSNIVGANISSNGCIDFDPKFVGNGENPYQLAVDSYCIGTGDNSWVADSVVLSQDIIGNDRIFSGIDATVDMGAYESSYEPNAFLTVQSVSEKYVRADSLVKIPVVLTSYPRSIQYTFLNSPANMVMTGDTIQWLTAVEDKGTLNQIALELDNGSLKDTLYFSIYVLEDNEYAELPDADLVWSADTIRVYQSLTVNNLRTLTINPGVCVEFQGHYDLNIAGRLLANGTPENKIVFTAKDSILTSESGGWHGIRFRYMNAANDTSFITNSVLQFGNAYGSNWEDSYGSAIYGYYVSKLVVANNIMQKCRNRYNSYGTLHFRYSYAQVIGNVIVNNLGTGLKIEYCDSLQVQNNTLANNDYYGLYFSSSSPTVINNIVAQNNNNLYQYNSNADLRHNNIYGNTVEGVGNISIDPQFIGSGNSPFNLDATSPCLNAGNPEWTTDSLFIKTDILGNNRLFSGTETVIDMGAYERQADPDPYLNIAGISDKYVRFDTMLKRKLYLIVFQKPFHIPG